MKQPLDDTPYPKDSRSRPIHLQIANDCYVYVQDLAGTIHVLKDGPHRHPRVLGEGRAAMFAGDLTVKDGTIVDVTNLSGTFQCDDVQGLIDVADELQRLGFDIVSGAVRFFPMDGSRPRILM